MNEEFSTISPSSKSRKDDLTAADVTAVLRYCPTTGVFTTISKRINGKQLGSVAGTVNAVGYVVLWFKGRLYAAHRIAWLVTYGEWPAMGIDHIDGNKTNNAIHNLRLATASQNLMNTGLRSDNRSGVKGVSFVQRLQKYTASIRKNGKIVFLGNFARMEDAVAARKAAETRYHGEFARP